MDPAEPIDVAEVCRQTGASYDTVLDWIHTGELPAEDIRTAGAKRATWRIDPADLEAFRAKRRTVKLPKRADKQRVKVEHFYV